MSHQYHILSLTTYTLPVTLPLKTRTFLVIQVHGKPIKTKYVKKSEPLSFESQNQDLLRIILIPFRNPDTTETGITLIEESSIYPQV